TDLERGIRELLAPDSDDKGKKLIQQLYDHPLINGLFKGKYVEGGRDLPSYIPARNFALALMDTVLPALPASPVAGSPPGSPVTSPPASPVASGATGATPPTPSQNVTFMGVPPPPQAPLSPLDPANPLNALRNAVRNSTVLTNQAQRSLLTLIDAAGAD